MERLIEYIESYVSFEKDEIDLLKDSVEAISYKKQDFIFQEGAVADKIYFVTKGCVRLFYNVEGNDKTAFFYTEGMFICAGESYTFNTPAIENYQAIEDVEVLVLSKVKIEAMLIKVPKMEVIARVATENELITCQKLIASFITKTAEERFVDLVKTQGELFNRVPQQYIASFLGVSPETLSRIKKRVHAKTLS